MHNKCTCTVLPCSKTIAVPGQDWTSEKAPQPISSLSQVLQPSAPLFPLLLSLQLLHHRDTASPRKFPPWPLTLLILAQALPPQLSSQDVPHLPKLSEPTPFADGVHELPQPGPSQSIPGSPPPGFPVHSAQAVPHPYLSGSQQPLTTCQPLTPSLTPAIPQPGAVIPNPSAPCACARAAAHASLSLAPRRPAPACRRPG